MVYLPWELVVNAPPIFRLFRGIFFGSSMGKVRSTYVDHLSTYDRSKIHVPCPIVYVRRLREWNMTSVLFLVRVKAFPRVLCEAHHIEAHGLQHQRCTAARAVKGWGA